MSTRFLDRLRPLDKRLAPGPIAPVTSAIVLVTTFYEDPSPARREELLECLRRNAANDLLDEIHVFLEDPPGAVYEPLTLPKVRLVEHGRRTTYSELFEYANTHLSERRVVIANADVYFDSSLARLDHYELGGKLLCLSRWDVQPDGSSSFFEHGESQDAWIFEAPIPRFACDFHLGLPACDNRLAWEADQAGLQVDNPARSIRVHHLHLSGVRRYSLRERIQGPTRSVPAGYLGPAPALPAATAAFAEEMGYAIATLEPGVSSHVNEHRPFSAVPDVLRGHQFTQVVACNASPVEVEFLTPGKLFVLVGNDWYGSAIAREWLADTGFDERLPLVATGDGVGFETWSLVGAAGDRVFAPTQVMLAGHRLEQKGRLTK